MVNKCIQIWPRPLNLSFSLAQEAAGHASEEVITEDAGSVDSARTDVNTTIPHSRFFLSSFLESFGIDDSHFHSFNLLRPDIQSSIAERCVETHLSWLAAKFNDPERAREYVGTRLQELEAAGHTYTKLYGESLVNLHVTSGSLLAPQADSTIGFNPTMSMYNFRDIKQAYDSCSQAYQQLISIFSQQQTFKLVNERLAETEPL